MNKYKLLNTYIAFAKHGMVEPLTCPDCENIYSLWIPEDDIELESPVLKCWPCNSEVTLANHTYTLIERAVDAASALYKTDS